MLMTGDSNGTTIYELLFQIFTILSTCTVWPYVIAKVADIMNELNQVSIQQKKELTKINQYMQQKAIDKEIQSKVINYLEYLQKGHEDMVSGT